MYVPVRVAPDEPNPVVLSFHGAGDNTRKLDEWDGFKSLADREAFVVVHPQGGAVEIVPGLPVNPGWDVLGLAVDEAALVGALLDELEQACVRRSRPGVRRRLFVGRRFLSLSLACTLNEWIAAVAVVEALPLYQCPTPLPTPTLMFHGLADLFVPDEGDAAVGLPGIEEEAASIAARNGCADTPPSSVAVSPGVDELMWTECVAPTILYRITDHGHAWPGTRPRCRGTTSLSSSKRMARCRLVCHPRKRLTTSCCPLRRSTPQR